MYEGSAVLRRPKPGPAGKMLVVSAGSVLVPLALKLLDAPPYVLVLPIVGAGAVGAFISVAVQPVLRSVHVFVDARGIFADGVLLTRNEDIVDAYLRPGADAIRARHFSAAASPMTVEIVTASGYYQIDGGEPARTHAILAALGRPLTYCAPTHVVQTGEAKREYRRVWLATMGPILLVALVMFGAGGFFLAKTYGLLGTGR